VQLDSGYNLMLQVPVVDYDSNTIVNGNAGINVAGQVCFLVFCVVLFELALHNITLICRWAPACTTVLS
jgi:hypothetical protein